MARGKIFTGVDPIVPAEPPIGGNTTEHPSELPAPEQPPAPGPTAPKAAKKKMVQVRHVDLHAAAKIYDILDELAIEDRRQVLAWVNAKYPADDGEGS